MRSFVFVTDEGHTFQPNSTAELPDVNNLQVIGFASGLTAEEAFRNLLVENFWLKETSFVQVSSYELKHTEAMKHIQYFNIKERVSNS